MTENLTIRTNRAGLREYATAEGDLVMARRVSGSRWLVTATANDSALTQVQGHVSFNEGGFRGRQWESDIDGQQHSSLVAAMREAVALARRNADTAAFARTLGIAR